MNLDARKILFGSLALNALLTLAMVLQTSGFFARAPKPHRTITKIGTITNEARIAVPADAAPPALPPLPPGFQWSQIESANLRVYITNLFTIGCPPETIRDLIKPEHDEQFAGRMEKVLAPFATQFWELLRKGPKSPNAEYGKPIEALDKEQRESWAELETLIGYKPPVKVRRNRHFESRVDFLPEAKRSLLAGVNARYDRLEQVLHNAQGPPSDERTKQLDELHKQRLAAVKNELTPAELDEYQLRTSAHARWAEGVIGFEPKPDEFAAVARLKMKLDQDFPPPKNADADAMKESRAERQTAEDLRLLTLLGPQRFAEYQRGLDADYQAAVKVAALHELPPERATQVYDIKRATEEHLNAIQADTTLSDEERVTALAAAREQSAQSLQQLLGAKAFKTYEQNGGRWLKP